MIDKLFKGLSDFIDDAYKNGWLVYLALGLIVFGVYIIFFQ